ncbi:DODA-type extradiol aromatic ring-opening family dioxygenase [Parasphingorhabdus cellanae]|uniref:Protocatechuate 3,4-dioxygenase n=1 Tax=Parasphingorhabdus cellanae TaxID=2806553 RepID=A0ABX7T4J1_9SPHN|nr:protocatechuate 3,4-dioxygenase [Parasphingorhabdus cellanae]QTD55833.1 protocatechuate 3,4-dioxygenase [Parasphingorhabdus cellanae]
MAKIVLGIGCAHTPQLHTMAKDWDLRANRDRIDGIPLWWKGEKLLYADLLEARKNEHLENVLGMETRQAALDESFKAIDELHKRFVEAKPDVVVIIGNDQKEIFSDIIPAFSVIATDEIENLPRTKEQISRLPIGIDIADHGHLPDQPKIFPGNRKMGVHIARELVRDAGFDVALCHEKPTVKNDKSLLYGMPHAYGFLYKNVMRDHVVPQIPVDVNCWYYENSPPASRCFDFGKAVTKAIESWEGDERVAVLTTGGLTHFVVDRVWDEQFLIALQNDDEDFLRAIPQNELMAGTSECKSWIATAGAMKSAKLKAEVVDYQTLIRTEGGTGSSCAFVAWS